MSGITFGNIQGNVTVSGTMAGRDIVQQSGLDPRNKAEFDALLAALTDALENKTDAPEQKASTVSVVLSKMMSLSADVASKVLSAVLIQRLGA